MRTRRTFLSLAAAAAPWMAFAAGKRGMIVRSARPEDLEMPLDGFLEWITPVDRFFVRSHHYTPEVKAGGWRLEVDGEVERPLKLSLDDLMKMPRVELVSVLECAGNGRALFEPPVIGLQWEYGAVGNGRWAGVRLADVLKRAGLKASGREVLFDGADVPVATMPEFQRTIPVAKALDPDTLLAYEINGEPLPASHGFPLRLVAPGWAGDCWVKWLTRIRVLDKEFDGFFMKTAYRYPKKPVAAGTPVDPADMDPVTSLRVKSVIATPVDGTAVGAGPVKIAGAAWSGASAVTAVEVSADGGRRWRRASLDTNRGRYAWRLWQLEWTPPREGYYTLMARARDASGDTQPLAADWNPSGYLHNVVHQVGVTVGQPASAPAPPKPSAGPLPANFKGSCIGCHELDVIEQQRLTRAQWEREVDKMAKWGATVKPEDRSGIVEFLVNRFGPRPRR